MTEDEDEDWAPESKLPKLSQQECAHRVAVVSKYLLHMIGCWERKSIDIATLAAAMDFAGGVIFKMRDQLSEDGDERLQHLQGR